MKQLTALFAASLLLLSLAACGKEAAPAVTEAATVAVTEAASEAPAESAPVQTAPASAFTFSTVDADGEAVDESIFAGHSLIMVNLWEPWCGPCVGEMPDLQKLYETYADRGLLILGVYATEEGVPQVLKATGIRYPAIRYTDAFAGFTTPYVPTTVFLDESGNLISGPHIGANSLDGWAAIIEELL